MQGAGLVLHSYYQREFVCYRADARLVRKQDEARVIFAMIFEMLF